MCFKHQFNRTSYIRNANKILSYVYPLDKLQPLLKSCIYEWYYKRQYNITSSILNFNNQINIMQLPLDSLLALLFYTSVIGFPLSNANALVDSLCLRSGSKILYKYYKTNLATTLCANLNNHSKYTAELYQHTTKVTIPV